MRSEENLKHLSESSNGLPQYGGASDVNSGCLPTKIFDFIKNQIAGI